MMALKTLIIIRIVQTNLIFSERQPEKMAKRPSTSLRCMMGNIKKKEKKLGSSYFKTQEAQKVTTTNIFSNQERGNRKKNQEKLEIIFVSRNILFCKVNRRNNEYVIVKILRLRALSSSDDTNAIMKERMKKENSKSVESCTVHMSWMAYRKYFYSGFSPSLISTVYVMLL